MPQELASPSYLICAIGDSRTFGAGGTVGFDPVTTLGKVLQAKFPSSSFATNNQAINGTTANHWLHTASLPEAIAAFQASAAALPDGTAVYVQIMLGINDASGFSFGRCPLPAYLAYMQGIIETIRLAGLPGFAGIVLHTSFYAVPGGFAQEIDDLCLSEVQRFNAELPSLADGKTVWMGDQDAYALFEEHPEYMFDKLHANNLGNAALATVWAKAYESILPRKREFVAAT